MTSANRTPWRPGLIVLGALLLAAGYGLGWLAHRTNPDTSGEWGFEHALVGYRTGVGNGLARGIEFVDGPLFTPWALLAMVVGGFLLRRRLGGIILALMTALSWLPGHVAKLLFSRPRPHDVDAIVVYKDTMSFPSGHTGFITALCVAILLLLTLAHRRRAWWVVVGLLLIALVGFSRLYAGAHYPLDVLGGFMLALGMSTLVWSPFTQLYDYARIHWPNWTDARNAG